MAGLWPWLAVAGLGALHGLNPATGWALAAAWGVRCGDRTQALQALLPIALGHAASLALVATSVAFAPSMGTSGHGPLAWLGVALLAIGVLPHRRGRSPARTRRAAHAGIALGSFVMSTVHGAGLMLVPALVPLCLGDTPAREITASGSLPLALAAVGVHTAAMLAVTAALATGAAQTFLGPAGHALFGRRGRRPSAGARPSTRPVRVPGSCA